MSATTQTLPRRLHRPLCFGLVGLSGFGVNTAVLLALVQGMRLPVLSASVLATEVAILSNFLLNDRWTFRAAAGRHSFGQRLLRFNGVALGGMAISIATLAILTTYTQLDLPLANVFAVGAAMVWNYVVNSCWTWRQGTGDSARPALIDGLSSVVGRPSSVVEEVTA